MSISIKEFKEGKINIRNLENEHPALVFLKKNKRAYTIKELAKETKIKENAIRDRLSVWKKRKIVVHKSPMFIHADHLK